MDWECPGPISRTGARPPTPPPHGASWISRVTPRFHGGCPSALGCRKKFQGDDRIRGRIPYSVLNGVSVAVRGRDPAQVAAHSAAGSRSLWWDLRLPCCLPFRTPPHRLERSERPRLTPRPRPGKDTWDGHVEIFAPPRPGGRRAARYAAPLNVRHARKAMNPGPSRSASSSIVICGVWRPCVMPAASFPTPST